MRIGALDLGSNSFHLLVAEVRPEGTFTPITAEKEMLRLGEEVSRTGSISEATADRMVECVRRLAALAAANGAEELIAKATSAIRSATNGSEVVDRIEAETGVHTQVISGAEEAGLIFAAVRASVMIDPPPALAFDLGGGSVEIMVGDANGLRWATSENLGVGRLTAAFVTGDPLGKRDRRAIEEHVREVLTPVAEAVAPYAPRTFIGSSGTLSDIAAITAAFEQGEPPLRRNQLTVSAAALRDVCAYIVRCDARERRRLPGLEEKRVELLPAGAVFLATAIDVFGLAHLTISEWSLREGIVLEAARRHGPDELSDDPGAIRHASVAGLARRCGSDDAHTSLVRSLALSLFDQTTDLHGLGPADREMLDHAAVLHDIGQHVSTKGHQRHAAYLVQHGELRGFSPDEIMFLAALVRHHRRGMPKDTEPLLAGLSRKDRTRVRAIAALLRVADGLDRGRTGAVHRIEVSIHDDRVALGIHARGDGELALWGVRRRRELFEAVFGRGLDAQVVTGAATAGSRAPA